MGAGWDKGEGELKQREQRQGGGEGETGGDQGLWEGSLAALGV